MEKYRIKQIMNREPQSDGGIHEELLLERLTGNDSCLASYNIVAEVSLAPSDYDLQQGDIIYGGISTTFYCNRGAGTLRNTLYKQDYVVVKNKE